MMVLFLMTVISAGAITFMFWFFSAVWKDTPKRTGLVMRTSPAAMPNVMLKSSSSAVHSSLYRTPAMEGRR